MKGERRRCGCEVDGEGDGEGARATRACLLEEDATRDASEEDVGAHHQRQDEQRVEEAEAFGQPEDPEAAAHADEEDLDVEQPAREDAVAFAAQQLGEKLGEDLRGRGVGGGQVRGACLCVPYWGEGLR